MNIPALTFITKPLRLPLAARTADFTNNRLQDHVTAAGVDVLSTNPMNSSARLSGISMAAPYVSGAFALLIKLGERKRKCTIVDKGLLRFSGRTWATKTASAKFVRYL